MLIPRSPSLLSLFLGLSLGIHIIGITIFALFSPKSVQVPSVQITLMTQQPSTTQKNTIPQKKISSKPITPQQKTVQATTPQPIAQKQSSTVSKPIVQKQTPIAQQSPTVSKPVVQKQTPVVQQSQTIPIATKPLEQPSEIQKKEIHKTTQASQKPLVAQQSSVISNTPTPKIVTETEDLSHELDQLLNKKNKTIVNTDFLADASWIGTPRKTLSFPNLTASIPQHYKARGYGFSVTAKITFSHQGWVASVDLIQGSGDPRIDSIFRTELRKIRIEPSHKASYDTITKTFKVSVK